MIYRIFILSLFLVSFSPVIFSQTVCTTLGQNPGTAFPVCGTASFTMASVPICGDRQVPGPCTNVPLTDKNPFWYKFTCFTAGTLSFLITPNTISDDYDWQLFDITNRDPNEVYTNPALFVACNWSGDGGVTGASAAGTSLVRCDGLGVPRFSSMPSLIQGHDYILLVSHFSNSQSGYSLSFGGGTANITDPLTPGLLNARAACDGTKITVKLNKKMKCNSLAGNGSDFSLSAALATITAAIGNVCNTGFDTDSITLSLSAPLPPGNYSIRIETGVDGNNLLDNCSRQIPTGQTIPLTVFPVAPTPMDSIQRTGCAPIILELVFRDAMLCSAIAPDGSDFIVTGNPGVTVTSASGVCTTGLTRIIRVVLSAPLQKAGVFQLKLQPGTDGNTLLNECGASTSAGATVSFSTADTVSALFNTVTRPGCLADTVQYSHSRQNGVNNWKWSFDNGITCIAADTTIVYATFGQKQATLLVSNGTCSDTAAFSINLDNRVNADFQSTSVVCPGDPATFTDNSTGPVVSWNWNFGNGSNSITKTPAPQFYPAGNTVRNILLRLIVTNSAGCADTASGTIRVVSNCYISVPKAFTPNRDGLNDFLHPTNAYKARDLYFRIFNRSGQLLFETRDWTYQWDGSFKGNPQDPGTYVWILQYTNTETGKKFELKGSTILIR